MRAAYRNYNKYDSNKHIPLSVQEDLSPYRGCDLPFFCLLLCPIPLRERHLYAVRPADDSNPFGAVYQE